jgi:molecular chaperone GrpE (heat shock protein)
MMRAADAVFKYYIYLADDQDKLEPWLSSLKSQGFQILSRRSDRSKERPNKSIKELDQERSKILVLECWEAETGLKQTLAELEKLESAHLSPDLLLGQVTLIASTQMAWSDIVGLIPSPGSQPKSFAMSMTTGQMYRTALAHHVYYACQPQDFDSSTLHLFNQGLPLIEAGYLELRMISRLLRERSRMVEQELRDLDQQLSRILHTHLVTEQKESKQAEELEEQIQALSSAYGMLATDMNLINEGRRRLQRKWERFQTRLGRERALVIDDDQLGILGQPFLDTLDNLNELSQTLITTRDSHQAAINVVRSRIDIMNSRTNIATQEKIRELMELNTAIQKQGLAFQLAAGLIEFIVLAYYSHSLWKNLVHNAYNNIPAVYQLIAVLLFSSLTTYLTHLLAEYVQGHTQLRKRIILTGLPLLLLLLIILLASIVFNSPGVVH